jgi:toxin ParE1/3/4
MLPVVRTDRAEQDLTEILEYLEEHSPTAAEQLAETIDERCAMLGQLPLMGRSRDDLALGLRSIAIRPYVLFYRVTDESVQVIRILHGKRDMDRIMSQEEGS